MLFLARAEGGSGAREKGTERKKERQTDRQTASQPARQTDRQTDRHIYRIFPLPPQNSAVFGGGEYSDKTGRYFTHEFYGIRAGARVIITAGTVPDLPPPDLKILSPAPPLIKKVRHSEIRALLTLRDTPTLPSEASFAAQAVSGGSVQYGPGIQSQPQVE